MLCGHQNDLTLMKYSNGETCKLKAGVSQGSFCGYSSHTVLSTFRGTAATCNESIKRTWEND